MKRVVVSVINDLSFDQRVDKVCTSLTEMGYEILLIGRKLPDSVPVNREYATKRMNLLFKKGALFYAFFNFRLFWLLLFTKADVLHANDLDTLLANRLVSKIRRIPLVYDSHEYFTGVPEIQNKRFVKSVWTRIEKSIFPKLKHVLTVNQSIANLYKDEYEVDVKVLRNVPLSQNIQKSKSRIDLGMPLDKKVIILQGAGINIDRGAEELLEAIALMNEVVLYIVGSGDVIDILKKRALKEDLNGKVIFVGRKPYQEMMEYTMNADVGVTLDKDTNINYRFSLPNKIFDYIKAGIPVLSSDLVELKRIIEQYQLGCVANSHTPMDIKKGLESIWSDEEKFLSYKENTQKAMQELTWDKEVEVLKNIYLELK